MRIGPKSPERTGDQPTARSVLPCCPECGLPMVNPGPPARWSICRTCPFRRIRPAVVATAETDNDAVPSLDPRGIAAPASGMAE